MSAFLQTLLGGALTIAGGLAAVWWQMRRADVMARLARAEQRREEGLLQLSTEVTETAQRFDDCYRAAERGVTTSQYLTAMTLIRDLRKSWEGAWAGVIGDKPIRSAWGALDLAARQRLPQGPKGAARQRELSSADLAVSAAFVLDLGHVLHLLDEFTQAVQRQAAALAIGPPRG
jgi:hypothetical protein